MYTHRTKGAICKAQISARTHITHVNTGVSNRCGRTFGEGNHARHMISSTRRRGGHKASSGWRNPTDPVFLSITCCPLAPRSIDEIITGSSVVTKDVSDLFLPPFFVRTEILQNPKQKARRQSNFKYFEQSTAYGSHESFSCRKKI